MQQNNIGYIQQRILELRSESLDPEFTRFLDSKMMELQSGRGNVDEIGRSVEENYQIYRGRSASFVYPNQQSANPYLQAGNQYYNRVMPAPVKKSDTDTTEFKVGILILGVVGVTFLLIALILLGINYMNSVMQGLLLYVVSGAIFAFSELYVAKKFEKFSCLLTGLSMSTLYLSTIIGYYDLMIFPNIIAIVIVCILTALFFVYGRYRDSGLIRVICLAGCYVSLYLTSFENIYIVFILLAVLSMASVYYPLQNRNGVVEWVHWMGNGYMCILLAMLLMISRHDTWPVCILIAVCMLALNLFYKNLNDSDKKSYFSLYVAVEAFYNFAIFLTVITREWEYIVLIAFALFTVAMTWLVWNTNARFVPYMYLSLLCMCCAIVDFVVTDSLFKIVVCCLVIFIINKICERRFKEFELPDLVYTGLSGLMLIVLSGHIEDWSLDIGFVIAIYAFAACIIVAAVTATKYRKQNLYIAITFAWMFAFTIGYVGYIDSIIICCIAAATIICGFIEKEAKIRIYGLVMMILVALKLAFLDFLGQDAGVHILVCLIAGVLILDVSFLYIYFEKKLKEKN